MEGLIDMEQKGCESMLHSLWDFQLWPQPWPWPWIFMVKFWKSRILEMGWPIDSERTRCELIECWTHVVTFNFDFTHDLDLGFQSKILKLLYLKNGRVDSLGLKGMSVGYDVGCTLTLGHNAWQIDRIPNGSVWNSYTWWLHQMETFFALLAICAGNSPVPGEFPTQRPVTRSFDV